MARRPPSKHNSKPERRSQPQVLPMAPAINVKTLRAAMASARTPPGRVRTLADMSQAEIAELEAKYGKIRQRP